VEGDEMSDPVADAARSILDGHIVLARSIAERGHFPAIDVLQSVSRLAPTLMSPVQSRDASVLRDLLATRNEAMDLVRVGAYVAGSDPRVDASLRLGGAIDALLRQGVEEHTPMPTTLEAMRSLASQVR
jgi:flagellar biosynthesis/type III secretory pathway ATPase